jgi:hypothetical protein
VRHRINLIFICSVIIFLYVCKPYEYPVMDPIPFSPVVYQGEIKDEAALLFRDQDEVYRIEVDVDEDSFDWDRSDGVDYTYVASDEVSPAVFAFYWNEGGSGNPVVIEGIGMRPRGGYSFDHAPKKKYKIIFPDERKLFLGLKRLNLNSNCWDDSMMREKLAYDLFNAVGVPSGRTAYTRLYINGAYKGLYLIVEQVKNRFFETRFGDPVGNCYKDNGNELNWAPLTRDAYIASPTNTSPGLEILTNKDTFDFSDIVDFISVLNDTPDGSFEERIQDYFCVHGFLSALAINALIGTVDDYWYYAHNFFLYNYHGRFMWIPWDLDHSFGARVGGFEVETSDVYAFAPRNTDWSDGVRPLIDRILLVPSFRHYYQKCLKFYIEHYFNEASLYPRIEKIRTLIIDAALEDPYQTITEQIMDNTIYANKSYIVVRKNFVWEEVVNAY